MAQEFQNLLDLGGLRTDSPSDKIPDRNASDCKNIDYSLNGLIQTRLGYSLFGNKIDEEGKCLNAFLFRKNFGTKQDIFLRVRTSSEKSTLEYFNEDNTSEEYPDGYFELLVDDLEPLAHMGFAIANGDGGQKINRLVMGNAYDDMMMWNGALATLTEVVETEVTPGVFQYDMVCDEASLLQEGFEHTYNKRILVDGVEYEYDSILDNTFYDVTPNPSAITAGKVIAQAVDTTLLQEHLIQGDTFEFQDDNGFDRSSIFDSNDGFIDAGFVPGQKIVIGGSESNDGIYTIETVAAGEITLIESDYLKDEAAGENITISAGIPKGNVLATSQRKLWLSGNLDNFSKVYYSQSGNVSCFGITDGLGSGGSFDLIEGSGKVNMIEPRGKNTIIIHKDDAIIAYSREALDALNVQETFETIAEGSDVGATNPKARSGYNTSSYFMTGVEGVKNLERVVKEDLFEVNSITNIIFPTLKNFDNSNASMVYYSSKRALFVATDDKDGNRVVISIYIKGTSDSGFYYDISIDDIPAEDFLVSGDNIYFVSSLDQNAYRLFSRNSDNLIQANHYWLSKDFTFDEPSRGKTFSTLFLEGYIKEGTNIKVTIYYGFGANRGEKEYVIRWNDSSIVSSSTYGSLGADIIGQYSLGGNNTDLFMSRFFNFPIHFDVNKATRYKVKIETLYEDVDDYDKETYWAISNMSTNPNLDTTMYNEMQNSNN